MNVPVQKESVAALGEYARIPIRFMVERILDIRQGDSIGFTLTEQVLDRPYLKDYDAMDSGGPEKWPEQFDLSNWVLLAAHSGGQRVGGAAVALDTPGVRMPEGRTDLAVLWDIRVSTEIRGQGVGSALFRAAEREAIEKGCTELKVETQNINVPACRFYEAQGCRLRTIDRCAYPQLPNEVQMLWYKDLVASANST